jgi:hypothetical protein
MRRGARTKKEKDDLSVVNRLNAVCKEVEALEKTKSLSASKRLTELNRLQSLIKEAQFLLILAESDRRRDARDAQIQSDAEKAFEALPKSERAKFKDLMRNLQLLGDMEKAAEKAGVSRQLLSKFLDILAPAGVHDIRLTASGNLMRAKLRKGVDIGAKLAAQNLKDYSWRTWLAAEGNDKKFFIELGKCLSDKNRAEWTSKMSRDVASIFLLNPNISDKDGVRELKDKFGWTMSEDNFRMWKMRLGVNKFLRKQNVLSSAERLPKV